MIWNLERVKYDANLKKNKDTNKLKIKYVISDGKIIMI